MYPRHHAMITAFLSLLLWTFLPQVNYLAVLTIFLSSLLIDIDHYVFHVWKSGNFSLREAYRWFAERKKKAKYSKRHKDRIEVVFIFHGLEFVIVLSLLAFFSYFFLWILIGVLFHMALDYAECIYYKKPFNSKISQLYNLMTNR